MSGGGSTLDPAWSNLVGAWQRFFVMDRTTSTPLLASNWNTVWIRPYDDYFVTSNYGADGISPATVYLWLDGGYSNSDPTANVALWTSSAGYLDPNSASTLATTSSMPSDRFVMREPRRDHLVYLKSAHGLYVNIPSGSNMLYNQLASLDSTVDNTTRQSAAFWIVDHNGGELEYGDLISIEGIMAQHDRFWSTYANGDGQLNTLNAYGLDYETFTVVSPTGQTGPVGHADTIALRSYQGTYVTAMPPTYFSSQLRNYGTYIGSWQEFEVRFVEDHDVPRPTW